MPDTPVTGEPSARTTGIDQSDAHQIVTAALRRHYDDWTFRAAVDEAVHVVLLDDRYDAEEYDVRRGAVVALHLLLGQVTDR